jgi:hypothetical protein
MKIMGNFGASRFAVVLALNYQSIPFLLIAAMLEEKGNH